MVLEEVSFFDTNLDTGKTSSFPSPSPLSYVPHTQRTSSPYSSPLGCLVQAADACIFSMSFLSVSLLMSTLTVVMLASGFLLS